jgi:pyridoxal 5'-phosphate synthase pdxS subunit
MVMNDTMAHQTANGPATENGTSASAPASFTVKAGLAQMLKGGVIMDVVNAEQVPHPLISSVTIPED